MTLRLFQTLKLILIYFRQEVVLYPGCIPCPTLPKIFISDSLWLFCIKINLKIDQITNEILVIEIPFSDIAMCVIVLCVFFLCLVYWSEIVCQHLYVPPIHAGMPIRV